MSTALATRRVIHEYAGNDALLMKAIHSAADAIAASSIAGSSYSFTVKETDFRILQDFIAYAASEFVPLLRREITKSDQVELAHDAGDRLVLTGEMA